MLATAPSRTHHDTQWRRPRAPGSPSRLHPKRSGPGRTSTGSSRSCPVTAGHPWHTGRPRRRACQTRCLPRRRAAARPGRGRPAVSRFLMRCSILPGQRRAGPHGAVGAGQGAAAPRHGGPALSDGRDPLRRIVCPRRRFASGSRAGPSRFKLHGVRGRRTREPSATMLAWCSLSEPFV
jgi:hypothetical protein